MDLIAGPGTVEVNRPGVPGDRILLQIIKSRPYSLQNGICKATRHEADHLTVRSGCVVRGKSIRCSDELIRAAIQTPGRDLEPALLFALAHEYAHARDNISGGFFVSVPSVIISGTPKDRQKRLLGALCTPVETVLRSEEAADRFATQVVAREVKRLPSTPELEAFVAVDMPPGTTVTRAMVDGTRIRFAARQLARAAVTFAEQEQNLPRDLARLILAPDNNASRASGTAAAADLLCEFSRVKDGTAIPTFTRSSHPHPSARMARAYEALAEMSTASVGQVSNLDDAMFQIEAALSLEYADYLDGLGVQSCNLLQTRSALSRTSRCSTKKEERD